MVATTRGANSPRKLKFTEKIVTKGLTTDALVKKMKVCLHLRRLGLAHLAVGSAHRARLDRPG